MTIMTCGEHTKKNTRWQRKTRVNTAWEDTAYIVAIMQKQMKGLMIIMNEDWYDNRYLRPPNTGKYLVYSAGGEFYVITYNVWNGLWNVTDDTSKAIEVAYWTFLPTLKDMSKRVVTRRRSE